MRVNNKIKSIVDVIKSPRFLLGVFITIQFLVCGLFVELVPYQYKTELNTYSIEQSILVDSSSSAYGFGGDFENVTISWDSDITDGSLVFIIESVDGVYMRTSEPNGTTKLSRPYFLEFPYEPNRGGSDWRGVHLYFRSDNGTTFTMNFTIDGFIWYHYVDIESERMWRTSVIVGSLIIWMSGFVLVLSMKDESKE